MTIAQVQPELITIIMKSAYVQKELPTNPGRHPKVET